MRVIAIANQKGGSAKSTTAIHLAAGLAATGKRVLCCDLDPQGHVGEGLGLDARAYVHEMSEVLDRKIALSDAVIPDVRDHLDVVPATIRLSSLEASLITKHRREDRLKLALATVADYYDYVIVDCPPSLGILTVNALSAADEVLIPMAAEYFALLGVELLLETIAEVQSEINPQLQVIGILPTRYTRTVNAREIVEQAREQFEETHRVFDLRIPDSVKFREGAGLGKTIFEHAPETPGAKAYLDLVKEVDRHAR